MAEVTVRTATGSDSGTVALADDVFGIQPNVPVMHQVVTAQLAARRAGTHSTKTRAEVRGGGRKPYKQKGTGNARLGSNRAPQFSGGGIALGPKPRSYHQRTPKKMVRLALRSALSDRAAEGRIVVVDRWAFDTPSTKGAAAALSALGIDDTALVVVGRDEEVVAKSFRNLPAVQLVTADELNAYDVLCNTWVVFSTATLPGGQTSPAAEASTAAGIEAPAEAGIEAPAEADDEPDTEAPAAAAEPVTEAEAADERDAVEAPAAAEPVTEPDAAAAADEYEDEQEDE